VTTYEELLAELARYEPIINQAKVMKLEVNCGPAKRDRASEIKLVIFVRDLQLRPD
jgi:hypothetical protein